MVMANVLLGVLLGVPHYPAKSTQDEEAWQGLPDGSDSGKPLLSLWTSCDHFYFVKIVGESNSPTHC